MAQFDVHEFAGGLVVDCQSDLLAHLASRLVAPLVPVAEAPAPARRLNPVLEISGARYVMVTESAAAVRVRSLGPTVASLSDRSFEITGAFDVLLSGV